jgi:TP901 family phage tail tape measure protein
MPVLRVLGEANTLQAQKQFAALTAQVEALNVAMAKTALVPTGGTAKGYASTTAALSAAGHAYNTALASSGAFRVETLKVNDVIAQQTDLLRRQKLGYKDVWGSEAARKRMQLIRKEQVAMRNMTIRAVQGGIGDGHLRASLAIPKDVSQSWDTLRSRVGMFGHELSSVSRTMLNWGKNTQWAGRQLMAGITYPMAAFGAAAGVMAYKVDKQLTRIQKVYNTTSDQFSKNTEESKAAMAELSQLAVDGFKTASDAAREYGVSVTDTLAVQAELAATGQKGQSLQKATTEVMKSAMLGEIDYQTATKATIGLQQTLNLSSQELAETWAYMNSVENQTSLSMADFATAIPIALGPLKQMGGTVQDLGTLLTAMVSRGVQVGKAANAIKATAQRLLRPSQQVAAEFKAITGADIKEIAARNKGNILDMMKELYTVTKDLTAYDKSKAFAGLFGSYQLATMSAMVDGMGDLEQGIGQTTTAYKVGTQSAEEWGTVQQQEIKAIQESASGKFRIALETLKASLAEVGEPFLKVASGFLKATTIILDFFNALPSKVKTGLMIAGIFVALAGPALMLAGLFINLISNVGLFAGALLKMTANFDLFNKAEWAQMKLDQLYEKQLYSTTTAIELQTQEVKALTNVRLRPMPNRLRFLRVSKLVPLPRIFVFRRRLRRLRAVPMLLWAQWLPPCC